MPSDLIRGWKPVRVKQTRQNNNPEPRFDSIETEKALEPVVCTEPNNVQVVVEMLERGSGWGGRAQIAGKHHAGDVQVRVAKADIQVFDLDRPMLVEGQFIA